MKIVKFQKEEIKKTKIKREYISHMGERIYQDPEVRAVSIKIEFKDGSQLGFYRDEDEDAFEKLIEGDKD